MLVSYAHIYCIYNTISALRAKPTPIEIFDPETCDYKYLRKEYLDKGVPFILQRTDGKPISSNALHCTTDSPPSDVSLDVNTFSYPPKIVKIGANKYITF